MRINFDFGDLEAFLAVSEQGSFRAAAEQLNVSQSALSRRIQKLEEALGVSLFERTTRNLKLTFAAKSFRERAAQMLAEAQEAMHVIGDEQDRYDYQRNATVTIATVPTATLNIIPAAIAAFRAQGHHGRVRISDLSANEVLDAVIAGEADFGVNFIGGQEPGLEFLALKEDHFVLAMHRDDVLSRKSRVRWAEIDESRFVAVWKGSGNRMLIDVALSRAKQSLDWAYEVRHLSTALGLVEAGVGVTALPTSAVPEKNHPFIVSRPLIDPVVSRSVGVVRRAGAPLSAIAQTFHDVLVARWAEPTKSP